jgi:sugar/nucleoside kinase (ribokinase family)
MAANLKTIVAGHLCLDIIPNMDNIPASEFFKYFQPGHLLNIGQALFSTGGPVSNTGLALHILGIPTKLMGKVGDDTFGEAVRSSIRRIDDDLLSGMIVDRQSSTSYTVIINPPGIDRIFLHHTGANDTFGPEDVLLKELQDAALFHFGYPPLMRRMYERNGADLVEIFRLVKSNGITTSLDLSLPDPGSPSGKAPWKDILYKVLPYVDIFTPSLEELLYMLFPEFFTRLPENSSFEMMKHIDPNSLMDISSQLLEMGVKIVLIKLGEHGAYLHTTNHEKLRELGQAQPEDMMAWANFRAWAPCFQVDVVGTTGSGDATIAGFLCGLLRGISPAESLTAAVAVGAFNCEAADALSGLHSWDDTIQRIRQGWERKPLDLSSYRWNWSEQDQLWLPPTENKEF